ncbi:MAG: S8 family serine peptidase [Bdellovibrionales bacterium]|nr:S8 family serine peptidase [Bdellovibrionales bacterium]
MKTQLVAFITTLLFANVAFAGSDYLIKLDKDPTSAAYLQATLPEGAIVEDLGIANWHRVQVPDSTQGEAMLQSLQAKSFVKMTQKNYKLGLFANPSLVQNQALQALIANPQNDSPFPIPDNPGSGSSDNPDIPTSGSGGSGADPLFNRQWGMDQANVRQAWQNTKGSSEIVVAVIDTGVDYTHEDLVDNLWRNPGETGRDAQGRDKATNGIDDDQNGYVDDTIGWDFVTNDNKPYDLSVSGLEIITTGGNPGHGTHCAGNVAARGDNGKGIAGVAPNVRIMSLRFLSEKGQGTTADAIKAVRYAVDNGAQILSNSWGSVGEDPNDREGNQALRDAVTHSMNQGTLFVAAAGNGKQGRGYDNDSDSQPAYPASYQMENIISVAAIDVNGNLGSFSNWGRRTVDIGAPGVAVFSTTVGDKYDDTVIEFFGQKITWDGTSMATPHVAGAAALYWSAYPNKTWREVKSAILNSVQTTNQLSGKTVSGGQLDASAMMNN